MDKSMPADQRTEAPASDTTPVERRTLAAPLFELWRQDLVRTDTKAKNAVRMARRVATVFERESCGALEELTQDRVAAHLRKMVNGDPEWKAKGWKVTGSKTADNVRVLISTFFVWVMSEGHAQVDPTAGIVKSKGRRKGKGKSSRKGMRALYDDEPLRLIAAAEADEARPLKGSRKVRRRFKCTRSIVYRLALMTGARKGQLTLERGKDDPDPLRWRDVNFEPTNPGVILNDTKNGDNWWIPLCPEALAMLTAWRERCSVAGPDDYVFPFKVRDDAVNADLKAAGIAKRGGPTNLPANFHSLRRSFCTNLVLANVPVSVAQQLMQHKTLEMTLRVYAEIRNEQLAAGVARVQDFFSVGKLADQRGLQAVGGCGQPSGQPSPGENDLRNRGGIDDTPGVTPSLVQHHAQTTRPCAEGLPPSEASQPSYGERRVGPLGLSGRGGGGISPTTAHGDPSPALPEMGLEPSTATAALLAGLAAAGTGVVALLAPTDRADLIKLLVKLALTALFAFRGDPAAIQAVTPPPAPALVEQGRHP